MILDEVEVAKKRFGKPNTIVMNAVMEACVHCDVIDSALTMFHEMKNPKGCGVDTVTHAMLLKKCSNIEVQREIFKCLGTVVYNIWGGINTSLGLEQFMLDFVDQTDFMEYFRASWLPKIEMWLSTMRNFPLASQEASGALEAYHIKLKAKLFDDSHLGALQRVDWLVHKLTTELHSSYWLDCNADESDSFQNVKEEYIASTSWHRAL
ncbi:uncharacterized protein LOC133317678 [Gastrolobium bilobum]|uniref:uncharacterized protein LOC133317678 n=1 Tax=Gastrolobium bilobum TaxID=150636 RepID=UPI002AB0C19D|nr:uncharacterized protein LOC133317678 [Gastrolobium bilobum]